MMDLMLPAEIEPFNIVVFLTEHCGGQSAGLTPFDLGKRQGAFADR